MATHSQTDNQGTEQTAKGNARTGLAVLWVLTVMLFGFGDAFTTTLALNHGGIEGNPIVRALIDVAGGNPWVFTMVKLTVLVFLIALSHLALGRYAWILPTGLACVGAYLVAQNIALLFL